MKLFRFHFSLLCLGLLAGCVSSDKQLTPDGNARFLTPRDTLEGSLFPSDQQVLNDEAVGRILASRVVLPDRSKIAVMRYPDRSGWDFTDYRVIQENPVNALTDQLLSGQHISEVVQLPSLLTPKTPTIPILREAAVRLQSDLLLVFRLNRDLHSRYGIFEKDKVKARGTCEAVLLDVRTGIIPFTTTLTREVIATRIASDYDSYETARRAETEVATVALTAIADEVNKFLRKVPAK